MWPANWPAVLAFQGCASKWDYLPTLGAPVRTGINYTALDVLMRRRGLPDATFDDVREMEFAALAVFGAAAEDERTSAHDA